MVEVPTLSQDMLTVTQRERTLRWQLPTQIILKHHHASRGERYSLLALTRLCEILLVGCALGLVYSAWPNLHLLFWQKGNLFLLGFALSGLALLLCASLLYARTPHTKKLRQISQSRENTIDLSEYADEAVHAVISEAATLASALGSTSVEPIHLFAALLKNDLVGEIFLRLEIDVTSLQRTVFTALGNSKGDGHRQALPPSPALQQQLTLAAAICLEKNFYQITPANLFLCFLDPRSTCAPASRILGEARVHTDEAQAVCSWISTAESEVALLTQGSKDGTYQDHGQMNRAWTAKPTPYLNSYSRDLTQWAAYGHVVFNSPYSAEVTEALTTLAGGAQRNVLIVAPEGADTESILLALASRILEGNVPASLHDTRLLELDVTRLLSSSEQSEQAVLAAVDEASQAGNVVLVLPKVAVLTGSAGAALDGSQVLANALRQHEIQVITLATTAEYHRYVEQNSSLTQELRKIELHQLTQPETVLALESIVPSLENTIGCMVSYPALVAAAEEAERYLPEQAPPSGARNVLEIAAKLAGRDTLVTRQHVGKAMESLVNAPVLQASGHEAELLMNLEQELHARVIGQNEAVESVASFLRRARAGLQNPRRPVGSFLFVGPTGVGKTELAKAVSDLYFGPDNPMLRLDMSEYADPTAIYRLIGAPPGSSNDHLEGGALTQPLRDHGFRLVLLDELEKSHPDVLNLFLQILDDGRITENTGRTIPVTNVIIIATSNVAARDIAQITQGEGTEAAKHEAMLRKLETVYQPEFLNRFDAIVAFHSLSKEEIQIITGMMLQDVVQKMKQQEIDLSFTPEAIAYIAELGYDPAYGARPLRRAIEHTVEGALAKLILEQKLVRGSALAVTPELLQTHA